MIKCLLVGLSSGKSNVGILSYSVRSSAAAINNGKDNSDKYLEFTLNNSYEDIFYVQFASNYIQNTVTHWNLTTPLRLQP